MASPLFSFKFKTFWGFIKCRSILEADKMEFGCDSASFLNKKENQ